MPPISIIIAAYNEEKYLGQCLNALQSQLKAGDEIIVVDNNSTDSTAAIARQFDARVIHEKRQGLSFARNAGFAAAKNKLLARTDADTNVCAEWLQVIRDFYAAGSPKRAFSAITGPVYLREFLPLRYGVHQGFTKKALGHETLVGSNIALTKQLWQKTLPLLSNDDNRYAEDMEMAGVIIGQGGAVNFLPGMIVYTSGRWMIHHPFRSFRIWKYKLHNTRHLLGL